MDERDGVGHGSGGFGPSTSSTMASHNDRSIVVPSVGVKKRELRSKRKHIVHQE